jgi:hypothetical protein
VRSGRRDHNEVPRTTPNTGQSGEDAETIWVATSTAPAQEVFCTTDQHTATLVEQLIAEARKDGPNLIRATGQLIRNQLDLSDDPH